MIIFVTTSRENMPEAFRFHAFDYIVKPVSEERLRTLFDDALNVLPTMNRYMTFTADRREVKLLFSDCISAASSGHYLLIRAKSGEEYRTRMTIKEFTDMIDEDERFLAINKGIFVNMDHIRNITERTCIMANGQKFPIKVRESQLIERTWQNYCFDQLRKGQNA
ncbi:MAG: LytTR family transcriptional regulator DNA-binding domain-containing protein [Lachnospiraceae bacterium]|nr:LytTR family transcriptional regulator DNA-binding domain-containing protein [Lachnospiraceae bacterium]